MRIPTGSIVTALVLSAALLVTGCIRPGVREAPLGAEVYLQPAASQGPDPFTDSTATEPTTPQTPGSGATGSIGPAVPDGPGSAVPTAPAVPTGSVPAVPLTPTTAPPPGIGPIAPTVPASARRPALPAALPVVPLPAMRALPGGTPGLYGGTERVAGCDVERQIGYLTADRARGGAFAGAAGISAPDLPGYLRGLTPVMLRADTRVTNHAYRAGQAAAYQAVLQAGTAVLVDNRGVPRVRCACGNPLGPPAPGHDGLGTRGTVWSGYRPGQVIAVTPAPRAVAGFTILDVATHTWIGRRIGHDVRRDQIVPAPARTTTALPDPDPADPAPTGTGPPYTLPPSPRPGTTAPSAPAPGLALQQNPPSLDLTLDPPYDIGPPDAPAGASGGGQPHP
ncbi:DUF6777 domain-containing protein [Streptomyces sp. NPDC046942]|uniref:DUF6777 domain-containing protein n=1 Tax=Streptomyces sp. NPDC046942 TaxID=3155137 RepID=UPI0033CF7F64